MKIGPLLKTFYKDWEISTILISRTYEGVLEGGPSEILTKSILLSCERKIKKEFYVEDEWLNIIPRFKSEEKSLLHSIEILIKLFSDIPQIKTSIVTFIGYEEEFEDIIKEILERKELKTIEWDW